MSGSERLDARVHGLVQGVLFRHYTQIQATRLELVGTVRNLPGGSVRVIAEGPREKLDRLLDWLRRGPELARVERVDAEWQSATGDFAGFDIVR